MKNKWLIKVLRFMIWMAVWQLISLLVRDMIPFAGPCETIITLVQQMLHLDFYIAVWTTFSGIALGFITSLVLGTLLGYAAYFNEKVNFWLTPVIDFFRYIPMITFTILAIMWTKSSALAFEVGIFLSFPVIYKHTLTGLKKSDQHYLERARSIKMPLFKKMIFLYQPVAMPDYLSGCHRASNMCWKSGIIAQFLGMTKQSIGSMLYVARDNADVASVFAWTIVTVALSIAFERIVIRLLSTDHLNAGRVDIQKIFEEINNDEVSL
jgi:NitT/TauT family transport system permease protein